MTQLRLPLGLEPDADEAGFIVGDANARAVHLLEHWSAWPVMAALLVGPPKSGRSRLGRIFAARTGGTVIDDAERADEAEIFHAWNAAQRTHSPLLIIADATPPEWSIRLPDLRSRLAATPVLRIDPPDDALFEALIRQALERHMLYAGPEFFNWLAQRTDRSYGAVDRITDRLAAEALVRDIRRVTIPFARACLSEQGLIGPADRAEAGADTEEDVSGTP